jgi:5-methylcytosine-specific restriction protein A
VDRDTNAPHVTDPTATSCLPPRATAPLRYCATPRCPNKVTSGHCAQHQQRTLAEHKRFTKGKYGRPWRRAVAAWIAEDPDTRVFCVDCKAEGRLVLGDETDHIIPHRGDDTLFWDRSNWARRCKAHHSAKTAKEVGWR